MISLSSVGHRRASVDVEDPNFEHREYDRWAAYGQSKTANALFAVSLDTVGEPHDIRAFSVHPGGVITELISHMTTEEVRAYGVLDEHERPIIDPARNMKTPEQGAATSVWCATSRQLEGLGGVYCEDCDIAIPVSGDSKELRGVDTSQANECGWRKESCYVVPRLRAYPPSDRAHDTAIRSRM